MLSRRSVRALPEGFYAVPMERVSSNARRLTIGVLGWPRLSLGATEGGGLGQVIRQLSSELAARGHRVVYLRSGLFYSMKAGIRIDAEEAWNGVECFDLVNSPNLSGSHNFENVREQVSAPEQTRAIVEFLKAQNADLLHLHGLEGVSFDVVAAVRRAGIPVVVTPHNYVALCPQIDLLRQERWVCDDYEGGRRCVDCLKVPDFRWERRRRARAHTMRRILGDGVYESIKPLAKSLGGLLSGNRGDNGSRRAFEAPAPEGSSFVEPLVEGKPLAHERVLEQRDRHLVVLNEFGERRRAGVQALNAASLVLPPGEYLRRVHEAMGVEASRMRPVPLGLRHIDELRDRCRTSATFDSPSWRADDGRPLALVYFGNCWANKGLSILLDAFEALDAPVRERVELDIYASGDDRAFRERMRALPRVRFHGAFNEDDQAAALERADVGVFPGVALENSPLVILEMLASGRFVIATRRGAMEEFVREGRNGLLFHPGDPRALAQSISQVVRGEVPLPTRRAVQEASRERPFGAFVDEMESVFEEIVAPGIDQRTPAAAALLTSPETRR